MGVLCVRRVEVHLTYVEKNKFKTAPGLPSSVHDCDLLIALGKCLQKDWQLAKDLQEFHVLHCPCHCPRATDCNFIGNLRPERFASFERDGDVVFINFKKARHAADLNKLLQENYPMRTTIAVEVSDDYEDEMDEEDSAEELRFVPRCSVAATLLSMASGSGNTVVLRIASMSGQTTQVTLPADASVADAIARIKAEWGLDSDAEVHLLTTDEKLPAGLLLASMRDFDGSRKETETINAEETSSKRQINPTASSSQVSVTRTTSGYGVPARARQPTMRSDEKAASAATRNIALIRGVYQRHEPQKLADLDGLIAKHVGEERAIYEFVCKKYGEDPAPRADREPATKAKTTATRR